VLEIGFGRGHLLPKLRARGLTAIGLDASAQMVRHTAPRHRAVVQGVAQALPFASGTFGGLITTFPAPFVVAEASQRELARVLRPGGMWIWVDAPRFETSATTLPSALLNRALHAPEGEDDLHTIMPLTGWQVTAHRRPVGPSSIGVWVMRKAES
jgi:ubiquinone/menaquinone biosynthesis C-methylase UbiE